MKLERFCVQNKAHGHLEAFRTEITEQIIYQPRHGMFFIPESLGLIKNTYVDPYVFNDNINQYFAFVMNGDPVWGRKVVHYEKEYEQRKSRKIDRSQVSVPMSDFNQLVLSVVNNQPLPITNPKINIAKNSPDNTGRIYNAYLSFFCKMHGNQWLHGAERGILIDLNSIQLINKKI